MADPFQYKHIATQTTTVVKAGAGVLRCVTINTKAASSVITLYDDPATTNNPIAVLDGANNFGTFYYDLAFVNGLTIVTAGGNADITAVYR